MRNSRFIASAVLALSVSGCVSSSEPMFSSRGAAPKQVSVLNTTNEIQMQEQTNALNKMTCDIIRKSTVNGAAVAGCGLVLLSPGNAKNCVTGALAGGVVGTAVGAAQGKKQAAKRVELVSPSALFHSIRKVNDRMDVVSRDLPQLLKQQDAELASLNAKMTSGQITEDQFAHRFQVIKANRVQLAEALSLSAAQANEAHRNLQSAQAKGQTGLDWHLSVTKILHETRHLRALPSHFFKRNFCFPSIRPSIGAADCL